MGSFRRSLLIVAIGGLASGGCNLPQIGFAKNPSLSASDRIVQLRFGLFNLSKKAITPHAILFSQYTTTDRSRIINGARCGVDIGGPECDASFTRKDFASSEFIQPGDTEYYERAVGGYDPSSACAVGPLVSCSGTVMLSADVATGQPPVALQKITFATSPAHTPFIVKIE